MNLLRVLAALPGQLLIGWLNNRKRANGVPPLGGFLRGCVHGFVGLVVLMVLSMAFMQPSPPARSAPVPVPAPREALIGSHGPADLPTGEEIRVATERYLEENPPTAAPTSAPVYVPPLPDVAEHDHDWDKPRICHRKWWC